MNRDKQIEEMAKVYDNARLKARDTLGSMNEGEEMWYSKAFYNAGYRKIPDNIGEFSDGYHTFNELYHHRAVLFSVICNMMPEKAWKSRLHDTGDMFDGMFIVGIETEQGQATYHYDIEPYWDMFKIKELEKAPKWDGHTPSEAIQRICDMSTKGYRKASGVAREICCKIEEEIVKALESNYNAKAERMRKPCIDMADEFIGWVEGKISALRGIEDFVAELKKKYESEGEG